MGYEHAGLRTDWVRDSRWQKRIVPAFDKLKNDWARFSRSAEAGTIQQFAFEGGEEAFTQGIVKAITDRAH